MSKRTLLKNLEKVYCRVQPSKLHGVGVFAIRRIPKGINPFELPIPAKLVELTASDIRSLAPGIQQMIRQYAVKQNGRYVISTLGFNLVELEYFVNHSDSPNLSFDDHKGCYRTARVIARGEELTGDYNRYAPAMPTIKYRY
jgi:SET domain-containing protein